ncbi:YeiH family putative sulfate export transporter [Leptothermofonsia sichuanensis E412]|nr:YeiH family putative sulfate export transporter [Leptothermofonsia sichuanensis E412]
MVETAADNSKNNLYRNKLSRLSPGLLLVLVLASLALLLRSLTGLVILSPLMVAIASGILVRNTTGIPMQCQAGVTFCLKRLLRIAVALLGMQLSFLQLQQVGMQGFTLITLVLIATFLFTCWIGRSLSVKKHLACLIAVGTSICGASAIVATSVVLENSDEDTAYAVGIVTLFGTLSMLLYPTVLPLLHLSSIAFGIWCGSSIHEVAQAIAAAFQVSSISGEFASITKLARVLWLAPLVFAMGAFFSPRQLSLTSGQKHSSIPWFIVGFVGLMIGNSFNLIPEALKSIIGQLNLFLLATAMVAMGIETKLRDIRRMGFKPLYLGALSWLFITVLSLALIKLIY